MSAGTIYNNGDSVTVAESVPSAEAVESSFVQILGAYLEVQ